MTVAAATGARWPISSSVRRAVLTFHVIASVGLLGDSAGFLAVAIRAATMADRELAATSYELLDMFSLVFGIPLSFIALATGLTLGFGSSTAAEAASSRSSSPPPGMCSCCRSPTGLSIYKPAGAARAPRGDGGR